MRILANIFIKKIKTQAIIQGIFRSDWRHLCTACDDDDKQTVDEILSKNEPKQIECQNEDFIDLSREITLHEHESLTPLHPEVPCDYLRDRIAYIRKRSKHVMQQGTNNTHSWILTFNRTQTWENPLIGWNSTGDCLSSSAITFNDLYAAVQHCEKFGWQYQFEEEAQIHKPIKQKSYADNFSYKKRCRVSTK